MSVNRLAIPEQQERTHRSVAGWLWPLLPIGLSMFVLSALLYYHLRHDVVVVSSTLQSTIAGIYAWLGFAPAFLLFLLALTWSSIWFVTGTLDRPLSRVLRLLAMTVMLGVFMNLGDGGVASAFHKGALGEAIATRLVSAFGYYPSLVLVWIVTFGSLLLATDFFFSENFERLRRRPIAADAGVEAAVTEHLKGLATVAAAVPTAREPAAAHAAFPILGDEGEVEVEPVVDEIADEILEPPERGSRRESYFERRYAETGNPAWVPTAPEAQEIDNPETDAHHPAPAAPAPAAADPAAPADPEPLELEAEAPAAGPVADDGEDDAPAAPSDFAEPVIEIPRPEVVDEPVRRPEPTRGGAESSHQQNLFGRDDDLIDEATSLVRETRRVSATLLQRKLRIDYVEACKVLAELAARGVVELEGDQAHGRIVGG
jgi:hypothetical protein